MKTGMRLILLWLCGCIMGCQPPGETTENTDFDVEASLQYCLVKAEKTLADIPKDSVFPRTIAPGDSAWRYVGVPDWTSGFWPGML